MKEGFQTSLAANGKQAIDQIEALARSSQGRKSFDAILVRPFHSRATAFLTVNLDGLRDAGHVRLPGRRRQDTYIAFRDGYTAVREIRRMEASGELPNRNRIFALTGNARSGQVQSARDAGMDDVIVSRKLLSSLLCAEACFEDQTV